MAVGDVGAGDGVLNSNTMVLYSSFDWLGVNIEPARQNFATLTKLRPADANYNTAICRKPGHTILYGEVSISEHTHGPHCCFLFCLTRIVVHITCCNFGLCWQLVVGYFQGNSASHDESIRDGQRPRPGYRVTCAPLHVYLKDAKITHVELLSIDVGGMELTTVQTYPWGEVPLLVLIIELTQEHERRNEVLRQYLKDQGLCRVGWGVGASSEVFVNLTQFSKPHPYDGWGGPLGM